jgi:hypothetical protein
MSSSRKIFSVLFLLVAGTISCFAQPNIEQKKIDYLIGEIASLHDAKFIRNGSEYDVDQAVEHIRMKRRNAGSRIKTAENFIDYCATASSLSGEKYLIRYKNGKTVEAAIFLREKLRAYQPG